MEKLKYKYNNNLERIDKAFRYFDREDIPLDNKEKQISTFNQLLHEQNKLMYQLNLRAGDKEVTEGFNRISA